VNPNDAPLVRIAPFAKVTFCGDEILSVDVLLNKTTLLLFIRIMLKHIVKNKL
jgi:hypothetical protein